jgi:hypothetical protein
MNPAAPEREHTLVTATRAIAGAMDPDGAVYEDKLLQLAQHAIDDVRRRVELQQHRLDPNNVIVDVRVTAFVPALIPGRDSSGRHLDDATIREAGRR